jgi:hypothetical protein
MKSTHIGRAAFKNLLPVLLLIAVAEVRVWGQPYNTMWNKIGTWRMSTSARYISPSLNGVAPSNILSVSATILTDPDASGKVEVDYLDRSAGTESNVQPVTTTNYMGRGGICSIQGGGTVLLDAGPTGASSPARNRFLIGLHSGSGNRGWVRVDYTGATVNASQPYAVKTKVFEIGSFPIHYRPSSCNQFDCLPERPGDDTLSRNVTLAKLGYPMNRVTSFRTTLLEDDRIGFSDIYRLGPHEKSGGVSVLTDRISPPAAAIRILPVNGSNYFQSGSFVSSQLNRGFIKVDYLAAECGEGLGKYAITFINYITNPNDCHGVYTPPSGSPSIHVIQTQGKDIWNGADNFAFINKTSNATNKFAWVRVDKIENTNSWARAGIMFRVATASGSRHVSMVATPRADNGSTNGIRFTWRTTDNQATSQSAANNLSAPYWIGIQKTGNAFTGWVSTYPADQNPGDRSANPSRWTPIGSSVNVTFPANPTNYHVGLCQTAGNNTSGLLNTSVYSNPSF